MKAIAKTADSSTHSIRVAPFAAKTLPDTGAKRSASTTATTAGAASNVRMASHNHTGTRLLVKVLRVQGGRSEAALTIAAVGIVRRGISSKSMSA